MLGVIFHSVMSFPLEKGLYAITGENGSGKSTIMTCAASAFYQMPLEDYFGNTPDDAYISVQLGDSIWKKVNGRWNLSNNGKMPLNGFFEGSIIYGNRFKDTRKDSIERLVRASPKLSMDLTLLITMSKVFISHLLYR